MAGNLIPDVVWGEIEPLLPTRPVSLKGGRPPIGDREVLTGIIFVLKTGIPWEELPLELGCGCGMTCLRRLRSWQQSGVWPEVQTILEERLRPAKRIDWARLGGETGEMRQRETASVTPGLEDDEVQTVGGGMPRTFAESHPLPSIVPFHRAVSSSAGERSQTASRAMDF